MVLCLPGVILTFNIRTAVRSAEVENRIMENSIKKNDKVTVRIEDIGSNGEGIGKIDGYTLFIKDAVIGDVVEAKIMKAKKNYA